MKLPAFLCYSLTHRARIVTEGGQLLLLRHDMSFSVFLYHMGEFFAEVWLSTADSRVVMVHGFKHTHLLEPYLEIISLSELTEKE